MGTFDVRILLALVVPWVIWWATRRTIRDIQKARRKLPAPSAEAFRGRPTSWRAGQWR